MKSRTGAYCHYFFRDFSVGLSQVTTHVYIVYTAHRECEFPIDTPVISVLKSEISDERDPKL